MYAALLHGKLVLAIREAQLVLQHQKRLNFEVYRCPHCQKRVILVISQTKTAFFKHLPSYQARLGEKEEHHLAKLLFKSAFTAAGFVADNEIPLADGQLRADVLVADKLAIEVQCAPLSKAEFIHRHHLYQTITVTDLWVVGQRHYLGHKLKKTQLIFFRANQNWGNYYLEVKPQKNIFCLKYNIWQEPLTSCLRYQQASFRLDEVGLAAFWHFKPHLRSYSLNPQGQKNYLQKQLRQKSKLGLQIGELLYRQHLNLEALPPALFLKWRNPGERDSVSQYLRRRLFSSN